MILLDASGGIARTWERCSSSFHHSASSHTYTLSLHDALPIYKLLDHSASGMMCTYRLSSCCRMRTESGGCQVANGGMLVVVISLERGHGIQVLMWCVLSHHFSQLADIGTAGDGISQNVR